MASCKKALNEHILPEEFGTVVQMITKENDLNELTILKNNIKNVIDIEKGKFSRKTAEAMLLDKLPSHEVKKITSTPLRTLSYTRQKFRTEGPKKNRINQTIFSDFEVILDIIELNLTCKKFQSFIEDISPVISGTISTRRMPFSALKDLYNTYQVC